MPRRNFLGSWLLLLGSGAAVTLMILLLVGFFVRGTWLDALEQRPLVHALQLWGSPVVLLLCGLGLALRPQKAAQGLALTAYLFGALWFALVLFHYSGGTF